MKTAEPIKAYKFTALQSPAWRRNLTRYLIQRGFAAWEETDALYTDATIEEINWITGANNHFLHPIKNQK